jgi:ABC-type dipeptide/oligopeptide/nickel transport system permease subunit
MVSSAKQSRQSRILLFIKLFSIMGISWLLGLLAGYFDKEWLFIIYTIANVFQGFFIFLTFITNRKVVKLLKRC